MRDLPPADAADPAWVETCLATLKQATAAAHARVEATAPLAALVLTRVTLEEYGTALQRLYLHFATHEPGLMQALSAHLPAAALLSRSSLTPLRADLCDLGLPLPPVPAPAAPPGPEAAAGWLYVHEGTTLGGMVVARGLRRHLGTRLGRATRYYQRYGKGTAAHWRQTRGLIATLLPDPAALALGCAGAEAAFAAIQQVMTAGPAGPRCPHAAPPAV